MGVVRRWNGGAGRMAAGNQRLRIEQAGDAAGRALLAPKPAARPRSPPRLWLPATELRRSPAWLASVPVCAMPSSAVPMLWLQGDRVQPHWRHQGHGLRGGDALHGALV